MQERTHHRYVYNGSALIAEIDATTRQVLRAFAWGATGELLMINDRADTLGPQTYLPVRDASGSVTAMMRASDNAIVATYEYDPCGNLLRAQGQYAKSNPFTFGGGWMDWETGLVNAGPVYYSARLGRYINGAPSGGGSGISATFGAAPVISTLPHRAYQSAPGRKTNAGGYTSVDPSEWRAYQAALMAYEAELAVYEKAIYDYMEWLSNEQDDSGDEPYEEYSAEAFLAGAQHYHFTGTHGSFDTGLSSVYLSITIFYANGSKREIYTDGTSSLIGSNGQAANGSGGSGGGGSAATSNNGTGATSGGSGGLAVDGDVVILPRFTVTADRISAWPDDAPFSEAAFEQSGKSSKLGGGTRYKSGMNPTVDKMLANQNVVNQIKILHELSKKEGIKYTFENVIVTEFFATINADSETSKVMLKNSIEVPTEDFYAGKYTPTVGYDNYSAPDLIAYAHTHVQNERPSDGSDFAFQLPDMVKAGLWSIIISPSKVYFTGPEQGQYYYVPAKKITK